MPGYESVGWFGLLAPPHTPPEIVKKLNEVDRRRDADPGIPRPSGDTGRRAQAADAGEFGRYINADVAKWSKLVKDNDVQLPGGK